MSVYRIVDWELHFENNRTRELKAMTWVPVPNKHDGDGFTQLMEHKNGAAHLGVWLVVVQIASKCDPRGTLLRDSRNGLRSGHDSQSISRISRIPRPIIEEAMSRLMAIGWVEDISNETEDLSSGSQESATPSHESAKTSRLARARATEGKGTEGTGMEGKDRGAAVVPAGLQTQDFIEAWVDWHIYRSETKKKLTPSTEKEQLAMLEKLGSTQAVEAIRNSIRNSWQGLFEPKANGQNGHGKLGRTNIGHVAGADGGFFDRLESER